MDNISRINRRRKGGNALCKEIGAGERRNNAQKFTIFKTFDLKRAGGAILGVEFAVLEGIGHLFTPRKLIVKALFLGKVSLTD
jgi:hypothetical protein